MRNRILPFAAGLVVGVVIGAGVVAALIAPDDAGPTESVATPAAGSGPSVREAGGTPARIRDAAPQATDAVQALHDAVAQIPVEFVVEGTGRLTGSVRTEDGEPVAGVRLIALPEAPEPLEADYDDWDIPSSARMERFVRMERWRGAAMRTATSNADGTYAIERLIDAPYGVYAMSDLHEIDRAPGSPQSGTDGSVIDFIAEVRAALDIEMVFPDGVEPTYAMLTFTDAIGDDEHGRWNPAETRVLLPPGEYDLLLLLPHAYLQGRPIERRRVRLEPGKNHFTMAPPALHGLVVDVGPIGRAWRLRAVSARSVAERLGSFYVDARADSAGRVEFARLPAGTYDVRAWGKGAPTEPRTITVPADGPIRF